MAIGTTNAIISSGGAIVDANGVKYAPIMDITNINMNYNIIPLSHSFPTSLSPKTFNASGDDIFWITTNYVHKMNRSSLSKTSSSATTNGIVGILVDENFIYAAQGGALSSQNIVKLNKSNLSVSITSPTLGGSYVIYEIQMDATYLYLYCVNYSNSQYWIRKLRKSDLVDVGGYSPGAIQGNTFMASEKDSYIRYQLNSSGSIYLINSSTMTYASNLTVSTTYPNRYFLGVNGIYYYYDNNHIIFNAYGGNTTKTIYYGEQNRLVEIEDKMLIALQGVTYLNYNNTNWTGFLFELINMDTSVLQTQNRKLVEMSMPDYLIPDPKYTEKTRFLTLYSSAGVVGEWEFLYEPIGLRKVT